MAINSQVGGRQHLGHIGQALQDFVDAILAQGAHARLQRAVADLGGAGALADVLLRERAGASLEAATDEKP